MGKGGYISKVRGSNNEGESGTTGTVNEIAVF
jgi:hypothetical protein